VSYGSVVRNRKLFSWFWNFPDCELADSSDLNQFVQQEVFLPGVLHVLNNGNEPFPLFLPAQTAFAQDDQSRMHGPVEEFDEVSCVRREHREVMIERILPRSHDPSDLQGQRAKQIGNTHRCQLAIAPVLERCFHPAGDGSCARSASKPQPLSWSSRSLTEARKEPSIG
jgi:hypothetical protein